MKLTWTPAWKRYLEGWQENGKNTGIVGLAQMAEHWIRIPKTAIRFRYPAPLRTKASRTMNLMRKPVLQLNSCLEPVRIIWARKALTLLTKGKAIVVVHTDREIYPGIFMPSVIRLLEYKFVPIRMQTLSRKNIFMRDGYRCFGAGTRILMANGRQIPIEQVSVGDRVIDADGSPTSVLALGNSIAENAVKLRHRGSSEVTITTADHEFLTPDGSYVPIGEEPEYLVFPRHVRYELPSAHDISVPAMMPQDHWFKMRASRIYWTKRPREHGLPLTIDADAEFAYILGLFVGDGSTSNRGDRPCAEGYYLNWAFNINEKETLALAVQEWAKKIGVNAALYPSKRGSGLTVVVGSKMLSMIFRRLCGEGCEVKKVPIEIIGQYHAEFLRGLFDSDGGVYPELSKASITMTSYEAVFGAQAMLWGLGIYPTVSTGEPLNKRPTWTLILQAENFGRFMKLVIGEEVDAGDEIYGDEKYVYRKFKSIEAIDEDVVVYNFETESHSYIANGLAVHNCMYCGKSSSGEGLELEHVIPRSRGGKNEWVNLVSACRKCNSRKGDRTPEEAGMPLLRRPLPATIHTPRFILKSLGAEVKEWGRYLYNDSDGEQALVARG